MTGSTQVLLVGPDSDLLTEQAALIQSTDERVTVHTRIDSPPDLDLTVDSDVDCIIVDVDAFEDDIAPLRSVASDGPPDCPIVRLTGPGSESVDLEWAAPIVLDADRSQLDSTMIERVCSASTITERGRFTPPRDMTP